jgi:hypothetical protein
LYHPAIADVQRRGESMTIKQKLHGIRYPVLIAVLNGVIPFILGIGYLVMGKWQRFLFVFVGLQIGIPTLLAMLGLREMVPIALALVWIFAIVDGYQQAKLHKTQ